MICRIYLLSILIAVITSIAMNARAADTYLSIAQLHKLCPVSQCGSPMPCEGQTVRIIGKIDYNNVFDKTHYPQLPYEKFILSDGKNILEVSVATPDNRSVFKKIFDAQNLSRTALIKGTIKGFDMPIMNSCSKGVKLELRQPDDISFE